MCIRDRGIHYTSTMGQATIQCGGDMSSVVMLSLIHILLVVGVSSGERRNACTISQFDWKN